MRPAARRRLQLRPLLLAPAAAALLILLLGLGFSSSMLTHAFIQTAGPLVARRALLQAAPRPFGGVVTRLLAYGYGGGDAGGGGRRGGGSGDGGGGGGGGVRL